MPIEVTLPVSGEAKRFSCARVSMMRSTVGIAIAAAVITIVVVIWGDGKDERSDAPGPGEGPTRYTSQRIGTLCDDIVESSGLAAGSGRVLWTINDSGPPVVWRVRRDGRCSAHPVAGAEVVDWEGLARHEGDLYIGDIGDNLAGRSDIVVYRVDSDDPGAGTKVYRFTYPRGPRDAESLLIDPATGDLYVISKGSEPVVFRARAPLEDGITRQLERVGRLRIDELVPGPTDAAVSPDGSTVVFVTYPAAYLIAVGDRSFAEALVGNPRPISLPLVSQREAVTFAPNGRAFLWTSEGAGPPLFLTRPEAGVR